MSRVSRLIRVTRRRLLLLLLLLILPMPMVTSNVAASSVIEHGRRSVSTVIDESEFSFHKLSVPAQGQQHRRSISSVGDCLTRK
jgi:hypothetical protein